MATPRQKPLAWMFWTAAALWNVVALVANYESAWFDAVAAGQVLVASGWLATGGGLMLGRAALVALAVAVSVLPDYVRSAGNASFPLWQFVLAALLLLAASTALVTACWSRLGAAGRRGLARVRPWPRFSVADALGWTLLVAVVCAALPRTQWVHLDAAETAACGLLALAAAGIMVSLAPTPDQRRGPRLLAAAATGLAMALATALGRSIWGPCAFVLAWAVVHRLEASPRRAAPAGSDAPRLRLASHAQ